MSSADYIDNNLMENVSHDATAPPVHSKLMTNRNSNSRPDSGCVQGPGAMTADGPTNEELAAAGVSRQDGVVQQLSTRRQDSSPLASPRATAEGSQPESNAAITAGPTESARLMLTEAEPPQDAEGTVASEPASNGNAEAFPASMSPHTAEERPSRSVIKPTSPQQETTRRTTTRASRNNRSEGHSRRRSSSASSPSQGRYANVPSVVEEYRKNNITALQAQYHSARSPSRGASASHVDPSTAHRTSSATHVQQPAKESATPRQYEAETPRSLRQSSPNPHYAPDEYLRGGVPHAALDAPHIKYAVALQNMHASRSVPRQLPGLAPSPSTNESTFLPQVAQYVPDRFKYVPPTEEEKQQHKAATLEALHEWQEKQKARGGVRGGARGGDRSARAPEPRSAPAPTPTSATTRTRSQPAPGRASSRAAKASRTATPAPVRGEPKPVSKEELVAEDDGYDKPAWDPSPPSYDSTPSASVLRESRPPRSARGGRRSGGSSARRGRSSRHGTPRQARQEEPAVNPNAYRRRLVFDVTAPALSV